MYRGIDLGTSGVYFAASDAFAPNPASGVHAFCHCLPERWHQMSVILSAASCVGWVTRLSGAADETSLLAEVEAAGGRKSRRCGALGGRSSEPVRNAG